jgi:cyclophilin family peptidyl-prolyl cis-trans isomerase
MMTRKRSNALRGYFAVMSLFGLLCLSGCGSANTVVVMDTSMGPVKVELFDDDAPITVKNFLKYVDDKHYDGTIFHRVIKGFMNQGGGMDITGREKLARGIPIKNEAYNGKKNKRGTIAMARTDDPNSATDQFFINAVDNGRSLDRQPGNDGYAVFGQVVEGMDVVDKINNVQTNKKDEPVTPVIIKAIRRANS